jgi:hypothetical protein
MEFHQEHRKLKPAEADHGVDRANTFMIEELKSAWHDS